MRTSLRRIWPTVQQSSQLISLCDDQLNLSNETDEDFLKSALSAGSEILYVHTHSDGIDAKLGKDLTLCPIRSQPSTTLKRAPVCVQTTYCHRRKQPLADALLSSSLFDPSQIKARVLVWNACAALLSPRSPVGPWWGYLNSFLGAGRLGAIVTTMGTVSPPLDFAEPLLCDLLEGVPVGMAVKAFNARPEVRAEGFRLCVFGDGGTSIAPKKIVSRKPAPSRGPRAK